jgi:outer membrane assembly lipoprotein YfiO
MSPHAPLTDTNPAATRTAALRRGIPNVLIRSPHHRRATIVVFAFLAIVACAPGFQTKKYHTNPDLFNASMAEYNKRKWENAITGFERLTLDLSARDTLLPRAHWFLAKSHEARGEHLLAATSFMRLAETFPDDSLAPLALMAAGDSYSALWRDPGLDPQYGELAQMQYRLLASVYPDSPLRAKADAASVRIDEMHATKDYDTGVHYVKRKAFDSALIYFKDVVKTYPTSMHAREALKRMVEVYRRPEMKYVEEARETCTTLRAAYPADTSVVRLCPASMTSDSNAAPPTTVPGAKGKPAKPGR